ncbi:hypothetical protein Pla22_50380 [Rubripirellula amarantea]|uniref:Uncharacterized protein n=1 Tax=Rubripirellula amarantea TaxID=2527999 RepID=A0A5C5WB06_9BACT|nr:hypothetical protein [Rubripirellula amarantea]TWT48038.1 hypothetical protein Pla22_50380 [Rubripirellula amarantea]
MSTASQDFSLRPLMRDELKQLAEISGDPCVTILMPTHRSGPETQQDIIRFKNLVGKAGQKLKDSGHDRSILDPIESLSTNSSFWQHQGEGLAVLLTKDDVRFIELKHQVDERVVVDDSFFLLPLLRSGSSDGGFFVLTLTWDEAKLFASDGETIEMVETEALPAKFHDLVLPRDPEESLQNTSHRSVGNTAGTSTAMFHGHGEGEDKIEADRDQYLSLVGDQVAGAIYNTGAPLVVVATKEVSGHFESTTGLSIDAKVEGSPSHWSDDTLHQRVIEAVKNQIGSDDAKLFERLGAAIANSKGSRDMAEIRDAGQKGRIELLMICGSPENSNDLNTVLRETLRRGGEVRRFDGNQREEKVAAIFRF